MKRLILIVMFVLLLPVTSYAKCCDCCKDNSLTPLPLPHVLLSLGTTTKFINSTGIERLVGKVIHRTRPCGSDKSYMDFPRKLLSVTADYLILSSDILTRGQFEVKRNEWDDGNWEEWKKPLRVIARELIGTETYHVVIGTSNYSCIRCANKLKTTPSTINYYCVKCNTGFSIKEE